MASKAELVAVYLSQRLSEPETWRGVAVIATLVGGSQFAALNWGECAALGAAISGVMKIIFPSAVVSNNIVHPTEENQDEKAN